MANQAQPPLRVGDMLYGYCGGHFGRGSYDDKRVEAIGGDWVLVRVTDAVQPCLALYEGSPEDLLEYRHQLCLQCGFQGPYPQAGVCPRCGSAV